MRLRLVLLTIFTFLIGGVAAYAAAAAPDATVAIPWGAWVHSTLVSIAGIAVAIASWLVARLAPPYLRLFVTDAMVTNAVNYALAAVDGAVSGQKLEVPIANKVVAEAVKYAVDSEPKLAKWLGGKLEPLVVAKLSALGCAPLGAVKA